MRKALESLFATVATFITLAVHPAHGDADTAAAATRCIQILGGTSFAADGAQTLWNGSASTQDLTCNMAVDCGAIVNNIQPTYSFSVVGHDGTTVGHISCQMAFLASDGTWAVFTSFVAGGTDSGTGLVSLSATGLSAGHNEGTFVEGIYCHVPGAQSGSPSGISVLHTFASPDCGLTFQ